MEYTIANGADVSALIGALEVGIPAVIDDGALEIAAAHGADMTRQHLPNGVCVGIDDGALEVTAAVTAGPTDHTRLRQPDGSCLIPRR